MTSSNEMSRKNFLKLSGAAGILSVAGMVGCGSSSSSSSSSSTSSSSSAASFKLGHIGPETGAAAIYGLATMRGTELAINEINAAGGSVQFEYSHQDDEHDAEKSVNAYNQLKDWGLQILVGPTTTTPCVAVSAEAAEDNIFEITPSGSSADCTGGPEANVARKANAFQLCFSDPNQGTASAQFIKEKNLANNIAVIYNNSDAYSTGIYTKFIAEAEVQGLNVVSVTTFTDDNATDFSVQLNDAKNAGADFLFVPIYYTPMSLIMTQANAMGYDVKFFSCDGMDGILTLDGFDKSLAEGGMLLTPFVATATDDATQSFVKAYEEAYGETPIQFAADAYDCMYVIKDLIEKTGVTPDMSASDICDKLAEAITSDDFTFSGLTGDNMTWSAEDGAVTKDPKGMIIENGVYQPIE